MGSLAIDGGTPVRDSFLPYGQQWIDEADIAQVVNVLKSPFLTQGPLVEEFEEAIADYTGARFAVAFSSGTAALHAACHAAGLGPGDEILTSPNTFVATANCVLFVGAKPNFVDIDRNTYNIDPFLLEEKITERTKAIIPVDFSGQPADMDTIKKISEKYNLVVIEDAAHALGAVYQERKVGGWSDMTMFSFHPVKHITTGEGGVITTNNRLYYERLKRFRAHGITKNPEEMARVEGPWYYEMQELGYNYRMTDLQAALGLSQLQKIDQFLSLRKLWVRMYGEAFAGEDGVITPHQLNETSSSWHLYVIRLETEKFRVGRKEIFQALRAENIGVHVHYIPVYWHPFYEKLGFSKGICPQAEEYYQSAITLPLFPKMNQDDVETVIDAVKKVVRYYKK